MKILKFSVFPPVFFLLCLFALLYSSESRSQYPGYKASPLLEKSRRLSANNKALISRKVRRAERALVEITIDNKYEDIETKGTGFFLLSENSVATNFHLIAFAHSKRPVVIRNIWGDDLRFRRITHLSVMHDLAILEVEGYKGYVLNFDPSPDLKYEKVFIAGFPWGSGLKWIRGQNAEGRSPFRWSLFTEYTREDEGFSGAPILTPQGDLAGIFFRSAGNFVSGIQNEPIYNLLQEEELPLKKPEELIRDEMDRLKEMARSGNGAAQFELGDYYYQGIGVEKNFEEAVKWLRLAAENKEEKAQDTLGTMLFNGDGVEKNFEEAYKWLEDAALAGYLPAKHNLGIMLNNGDGVKRDEDAAIHCFESSAKLGYIASQRKLAGIFYRWGTNEGYRKSLEWILEAAALGHPAAQYEAGMMFHEGKGVLSNYDETAKWLIASAKQGALEAQYQLGLTLQKRRGETNKLEGRKWLLAAMTGNSHYDRSSQRFLPGRSMRAMGLRNLEMAFDLMRSSRQNLSPFSIKNSHIEDFFKRAPLSKEAPEIFSSNDDRLPPIILFDQAQADRVVEENRPKPRGPGDDSPRSIMRIIMSDY